MFYPRPEFCTDNGAMIALAGYYRWKILTQNTGNKREHEDIGTSRHPLDITVKPRWPLAEL